MGIERHNFSNVDAIIFDLGGVILNLDYELTINQFKKLGEDRFDELYSQANQDKVFDSYEIGEINSQEFIAYMVKFLPGNTSDQEIIDAWNLMLLDLPKERLEILDIIKSKYQLFLFSNTNDLHYQFFSKYFNDTYSKSDLLESYFIKTYFSHLVGKRKPNRDAFELVLQENNLNPEKVLFIDDSMQHIEGAKKLGIQTFHLVDQDISDLF